MSSIRASRFCASQSLCDVNGRRPRRSIAAISGGRSSPPPSTTRRSPATSKSTSKRGPLVSGVTRPSATDTRDRFVTRLCSISAYTLRPSFDQRGFASERSMGAGRVVAPVATSTTAS